MCMQDTHETRARRGEEETGNEKGTRITCKERLVCTNDEDDGVDDESLTQDSRLVYALRYRDCTVSVISLLSSS